MKTKIHAAAGAIALLMVSAFWLSTVVSEMFGGAGAIAAVKAGVLYGMVVLIPAMAIAGASGFSLGRGWKSPAVLGKKRRMKIIAGNGLLILLPCAFFLAGRAQAGQFDGVFLAVQAVELAAGAVNIALLSLNMRDGLRLRSRSAPNLSGARRASSR